jgi:hypothetical protein
MTGTIFEETQMFKVKSTTTAGIGVFLGKPASGFGPFPAAE